MDASSQNYTSRIPGQETLILPSLELESGAVLEQAPIAYKTWGRLNERKDNVMVICHAFTGSADVEDWYVRRRSEEPDK
jgi:homoserine O-acetyltransferase/O-succinyltransferase